MIERVREGRIMPLGGHEYREDWRLCRGNLCVAGLHDSARL